MSEVEKRVMMNVDDDVQVFLFVFCRFAEMSNQLVARNNSNM